MYCSSLHFQMYKFVFFLNSVCHHLNFVYYYHPQGRAHTYSGPLVHGFTQPGALYKPRLWECLLSLRVMCFKDLPC